jgi:6-phosphogluconolactonase
MAAVKPDVRIFPDLKTLSEAAALLLIESCEQAITERGRALIALSGGTTPARLYDLLSRSPYAEQLDWPHVHVFWGDERCVPPEDLNSNYRQAKDAFLSLVPIPAQNIHRVQSEMEPADAAAAYALGLKLFAEPPLGWPRFDLVLLGMGEDGHTAALFPGSPVDMPGATAAVTAAYQGRPANRVTLTPQVFNSARRVLFLAAGESKCDTLANVLNGGYRPALLPAQRIHPTDGELIWMVDQAAASKL